MTEYKYGMRLRGFAPLCQPKEGFIRRENDPSDIYHDLLVYDRKLTEKELDNYELDFIEIVRTDKRETSYHNKVEGFTVRDLLRILKDAEPDALIVVGSDYNNCDNYLYNVNIGSSLVGFFTEPERDE
jgi:hypothetical protein